MKVKVTFPEQMLTVEAEEGTTLLSAEIAAGLHPDAPCGGAGRCKKCRAEILSESGGRESVLACRTLLSHDLIVFPAPEAGHRILSEGMGVPDKICPPIKEYRLRVDKASLKSPDSDWERVKKAVFEASGIGIRPDPAAAGNLRKVLEELSYSPQAVLYRDELLALRKGGRLLTAAADIGTTTLVLLLADAKSGEILSAVSALNPQTEYGADVISRANYAMQHPGNELTEAIRSALDGLLQKALKEACASPEELFSVVIVGNTCMHHLFLGIDPASLVLSPYVPAISEPLVLNASDYGLHHANKRAKLFVLPCIAGFVGADTAAVMLASDFDRREELTLAIDIGTNGELVLGNKDRTIACSTAAGPALEGAKITFGMRGAAGAIDHAWISDGELHYTVIGGGKPRGICGSGLLDLTAALLQAEVLDETGRFFEPSELPEASRPLAKRLDSIDSMRCFIIAWEEESETGALLYLSQKDIREVQLAKAAIAAGIRLLLKAHGSSLEDVHTILLAGAFGNYMSPESACRIGLLPAELLPKIETAGNAAGCGALLAALNEDGLQRAEKMSAETEFLELGANPDFQECFIDELDFP